MARSSRWEERASQPVTMTEELSATTLPTPGLLVQDQRLHQLLSSRPQAFRPRALVHFAGVAQSVEHLFCKQVVRGSSPLVSSKRLHFAFAAPLQASPFFASLRSTDLAEGCPSGQREQTVNLPAMPSMVRIHHPPPRALNFSSFFVRQARFTFHLASARE